jgi:hypothetical protein
MAEKPSHPDALLKAHDFIFGPVMDRVIFSPSGEILEGVIQCKFGDTAWELTNNLDTGCTSLTVMLYTIVNEFGEIRGMLYNRSRTIRFYMARHSPGTHRPWS